jgi:hypothetical protein
MSRDDPRQKRASIAAPPTSIALPPNVPSDLIVEPVIEPMVIFRLTFATSLDDQEALLRSLLSNHVLRQRPRKIELIYSVLYFAISTWISMDSACANARAWPKNGDHIACLALLPGLGICIDRPRDESEHRSLWTASNQIIQCVVDVKSTDIEGEQRYTRKP